MFKNLTDYFALFVLVSVSCNSLAAQVADSQPESKPGTIKGFDFGKLSEFDRKVPIGKETAFANTIRPLLKRYCGDCHVPGQMPELDFLAVDFEADVRKFRALFADVYEQIETGMMPPQGTEQPTDAERTLMLSWIKDRLQLKPADIDRIDQYVVETYQDRAGNLWFGTIFKGAARYDGKELKFFSKEHGLPCNVVPSFAEDKDGTLWVGTQDGICWFNGKTFTRLGPAEGLPAPSQPSPLATGDVYADRNGTIWMSVGTDLYRCENKKLIEFKLPMMKEKIKSFAILAGRARLMLHDKAGNLWFGTDGDGVYKYDGKSFTHFTKSDGLCSNNITRIIEDNQGRIWFACIQSYQPTMTSDGGLCRYDGQTFTKFPEIKGLTANDIYTLAETKSGDIWVGATGLGAYRFDGKSFTLFSETDKPHRTRYFGLQSMLEDKYGTLWFGFSGGLFRFNGKSFYNVTPDGPWQKADSINL
jgi:streptogramin lyase